MEKIDALKLLFVNHYRIPIDETFEENVTIKGFRFTYKKEEYIILNKKEIDEEFDKVADEELYMLFNNFLNSEFSFLNKFVNWEDYKKEILENLDFRYVFGTDEEFAINEYIILV